MLKKDLSPASAEAGYSKIQYFFWLLAGCEISILKACRSDYNRQAGIGFTILMTSVFAAASGGYAGYYFTDNTWAAVGFGVIWSMLVFSIDRMLVVTLKKDPTLASQPVLMPLLGRMVLALLIAFIISIPIELLVFRDQIEIQKRFDKQNGIGSYQDQIKNNNQQADKQARLNSDTTRASQALSDSKNLLTDPIYVSIKSRRDRKQQEYNNANQRYQAVLAEANRLARRDDRNYSKNLYEQSRTYQAAEDNFNRAKRALKDLNYQLEQEKQKYQQAKMQEYHQSQERGDAVRAELDRIDQKIKSAGQEMDTLFHKSFIRDFIALENAAYARQTVPKGKVSVTTYVNESLLFFLWLIRILFFTLEILPTIAKISTPLGAYDRAIYTFEQDMKVDLETRSGERSAHRARLRQISDEEELRLEKNRTKLESKLQEDLLKDLSAVQYEIGKQKIEAFRKAHLQDPAAIIAP